MWLEQPRGAPPDVVGLLAAAAALALAVTGAKAAAGPAPSTDTLHYAVREEIGIGSAIADIVTDAGLHVFGVEVS